MGLWVRPTPRGGFAPPFPRSALGVRPEDPFRVAQRLALDPSRWSAVEGGCPLQRRVWCRASQDFPRHAAHPAEGGGGGSPTPSRPAPAPPGKWVCPHPTAPAPPGQGLSPKGTSISPPLLLPIACNYRLSYHPEPAQTIGVQTPLPPGHPPRPPPPGALPLIGERSPLTKALAGGLHSFRSPRRPGYRLGYPVKAQQAASPALTGPRPVKASRG